MEKLNFVKNGVIRLPPGFRFHPTDEELVFQYLKRKVFSFPLPSCIIPEVDICKYDPWDLPGEWEEERYFFSTRTTKYPNGNRPNRGTGSGYWKATGLDKKIVGIRGNHVVGMKKTLVFYRGKPPQGSRTDWIMHEYRLTEYGTKPSIFPERKNSRQSSMVEMEDWVLCRIFLKKRNSKNENENENVISQEIDENRDGNLVVARPTFYDFMRKDKNDFSLSSSSPGSSGITEVSFLVSDHEDNSSCNSFSSSSCRREL